MQIFALARNEAGLAVVGTHVAVVAPNQDSFALECDGKAVHVRRRADGITIEWGSDMTPTCLGHDSPETAVRAAIRNAVAWLVKEAEPDDLIG